jgi:hypothetical protein
MTNPKRELVATFPEDEKALLAKLGTQFVSVFYHTKGGFVDFWHIADDTLPTTIAQVFKREKVTAAMYEDGSQWAVLQWVGKIGGGHMRPTRWVDSREAAEMLLIHLG